MGVIKEILFIYLIFIMIIIGCCKNKISNNTFTDIEENQFQQELQNEDNEDAIKPSEVMQDNIVNSREFVDVSTLWRNSAST
jgi:hypothetical protein